MRLQFGKANVWLGNMDAINGQADEITPQLHKKFKDTLRRPELQCLLNNMPDSVTFLFMREGEYITYSVTEADGCIMSTNFEAAELLKKPWETLMRIISQEFYISNKGYQFGPSRWNDKPPVEIEDKPDFYYDNVVPDHDTRPKTFVALPRRMTRFERMWGPAHNAAYYREGDSGAAGAFAGALASALGQVPALAAPDPTGDESKKD